MRTGTATPQLLLMRSSNVQGISGSADALHADSEVVSARSDADGTLFKAQEADQESAEAALEHKFAGADQQQ